MLWEWTSPAPLSTNVVVTDSHLFVGNDTTTYAIGLASRSLEWSAEYGGQLAVTGNHLVVSNGAAVHAFALVPEPTALAMSSLLAAGALKLMRRVKAPRRRSHD